jgi:hypothetical protein
MHGPLPPPFLERRCLERRCLFVAFLERATILNYCYVFILYFIFTNMIVKIIFTPVQTRSWPNALP